MPESSVKISELHLAHRDDPVILAQTKGKLSEQNQWPFQGGEVRSNSLACQAPPPRDSPGKNIGVGCHFLLQGIFPTQGSNPVSPALAGRFFTTEPPRKPTQKYSERLKQGSL